MLARVLRVAVVHRAVVALLPFGDLTLPVHLAGAGSRAASDAAAAPAETLAAPPQGRLAKGIGVAGVSSQFTT